MGKHRGGGKKKGKSLIARAKQLRTNSQKKAVRNAHERKKQLAKQKKRNLENRKKAKIPYTPDESILLVGEGDFSFTVSLQSYCNKVMETLRNTVSSNDSKSAPKRKHKGFILATCLDSKEELKKKYPTALPNIEKLKQLGAYVVDKVDCTDLKSNIVLGYIQSFWQLT
mmetsp:Transcript_12040/g.17941  ORF Transcript_12040/g.17941 Transcript_12040/m.17941 type:complete len:169 (-) Transcript_12040:27-533(-)